LTPEGYAVVYYALLRQVRNLALGDGIAYSCFPSSYAAAVLHVVRDGSTMVNEPRHPIGVEPALNLWYDDDTNPIDAIGYPSNYRCDAAPAPGEYSSK
jgi:hypothetical protein